MLIMEETLNKILFKIYKISEILKAKIYIISETDLYNK